MPGFLLSVNLVSFLSQIASETIKKNTRIAIVKFSQFGNKVAYSLGFSSLHEMDRSGADMDLCWGNGFDNDRVSQLFDQIVYSGVVHQDADQLVYFLCLTNEGSKRLIEHTKTFGGADRIANSLIRGLDYRLTFGGLMQSVGSSIASCGEEISSAARVSKTLDTFSSLVDRETIPYSTFEKPNYITSLRFWEIITRSCPDLPSVLRGLDAKQLGAARYFIESKTGPFMDKTTMVKWSFPGYIHTTMKIPGQLEVYRFLASHIGEREAFLKIVDPNTFGDTVSPLIKQLAQTESLDHWRQVFRIRNCTEFLTTTSDRATPTFVQDLLASSITQEQSDVSQLSDLKKSVVSRLVSRGCVSDKTAMLLAGKNNRLKGRILEDSLGM